MDHGHCLDLTQFPGGFYRCCLPADHDGMHEIDVGLPADTPLHRITIRLRYTEYGTPWKWVGSKPDNGRRDDGPVVR